jgi:hypothetical protein
MNYFIIMADIISSSEKNQNQLMTDFKNVVHEINNIYKKELLSPLTITLGDEFQCVVKSLSNSTVIIIAIEELLLDKKHSFKLRYVLNQGSIETKINSSIAYEMLGSGLTDARKKLNHLKIEKKKFLISINDSSKNEILNNAFFIYETFTSKWDVNKDYEIVSSFIKYKDYKRVALQLNRTRSIIWKRGKTLNIDAYFSIKEIIKITSK